MRLIYQRVRLIYQRASRAFVVPREEESAANLLKCCSTWILTTLGRLYAQPRPCVPASTANTRRLSLWTSRRQTIQRSSVCFCSLSYYRETSEEYPAQHSLRIQQDTPRLDNCQWTSGMLGSHFGQMSQWRSLTNRRWRDRRASDGAFYAIML